MRQLTRNGIGLPYVHGTVEQRAGTLGAPHSTASYSIVCRAISSERTIFQSSAVIALASAQHYVRLDLIQKNAKKNIQV